MKLKTEFQDEDFEKGEVADVSIATMPDGRIIVRAKAKRGGEHTFYYDSLKTLYNDWSDYEEPKEYWYINTVINRVDDNYRDSADLEHDKAIGNYFDTREEAEKAVEKLKAWKRLKDKGFEFDSFVRNAIYYKLSDEEIEKDSVLEDLDLLFGGEE